MMELVLWNKARQAITEAKNIDEVKKIRDKAEALRAYAKQAGESLESQNQLCEIKLRAERRAGEMLREMPKQQGSRGYGKKVELHDVTPLKDIGITRMESHRWQQIAEIPEQTFEGLINEIDKESEELTESFILSSKKKIDREIEIQQQKKDIESGKLKLPEGKFEVIVVDPAWNYERDYEPNGSRVSSPYPEISTKDILNIQLPASKDCILWLWTTHQFIWDAKKIMDNWGFEYKGILVWNKEKMGMGSWLRMQCEFCLLGIKGKPIWTTRDIRDIISEPRTNHSAKPECFYKLVDKICTGRKLDYFARKERKGWSSYGTLEKEGDKK